MDADVVEPGPCADGLPRRVDVGHVPALLVSRNDPGIARRTRQGRENAGRRLGEVNRAGASFPVGEMNLGRVEIHMLSAQGQDFVSAASRQHQQTDRRHRAGGYAAAVARNLLQHLPEACELSVGQEPLTSALGVHRDGPTWIAVFGRQVPAPGEGIHVGQRRDRHVRHGGRLAQALVEFHILASERILARNSRIVGMVQQARHAAPGIGSNPVTI